MNSKNLWQLGKKSRFGQFIFLLKEDLGTHDIFNHAYAMAYVTLFSLVPSLAAVFALVSLFIPMFGENSSLIVEGRQLILKHLATGSGEQAIKYLEDFLNNTDFKKIGMTGFAGMVVTLTLLLRQIELALNRIFEISEPRTLYIRFIYFWTFLTLGTFSIAIAAGAVSSTTWGAAYLESSLSLRILNDFIYTISLFMFFFMLYKVVPNRYVPLKDAAVGGLVAAVMFNLAVRFFSLYISHFTKYEAIYGALSALPIFLFWIYIIWLITLIGASVTKRSMEGVELQGVKDEDQHPHLQSSHFQSMLPLLTLIKIYSDFQLSHGKGSSLREIARTYSVSFASARKSVQLLVNCDFVLASESESLDQTKEGGYFPRIPLENLSYQKIKEKLLGSEIEWLKTTLIGSSQSELYNPLIIRFLTGLDRAWKEDLETICASTISPKASKIDGDAE